jgi:hypothetical protein
MFSVVRPLQTVYVSMTAGAYSTPTLYWYLDGLFTGSDKTREVRMGTAATSGLYLFPFLALILIILSCSYYSIVIDFHAHPLAHSP